MANASESLIDVITDDKPKRLIGLNQNGMRTVREIVNSSIANAIPPAKKTRLTLLFGNHAKPGKPVSLPSGKVIRQGYR